MNIQSLFRSVRFRAMMLMMVFGLAVQVQVGAQGQIDSPEIAKDRKVTFRIQAPKAESVQISGSDFRDMVPNRKMTKRDDGVWEITVGPLDFGAYRYNFVVDGLTVLDPRNPLTSEANARSWSLTYVPGAKFMDTNKVPHGAVAQVTYFSKTLDRPRRMHVYTPPGYDKGQGTYPVFYLMHGATDSDMSWPTVGRAGFIMDNLIAEGKAKPMVVVMPTGHTGPYVWGQRKGDGSRLFEDEFVTEFVSDIMPFVEKTYRVKNERKSRAIAGLSMGGAQTLHIGIANLEKFAYLGVFSSGVFGLPDTGREGATSSTWEARNKKTLDNPDLKKDLKLIWFATGKEDFLLKTTEATVALLKKHGFDVVYKETPGGHTWNNWRTYLTEFAPQLFQ